MIITICAHKGGVSKTTTAAAIAQALAIKGKRTLVIDADAQASASLIFGSEDQEAGLYEVITGRVNAEEVIQYTEAGAIIPASPGLGNLDIELNNQAGRDSFLKASIEPLEKKFDYIIIDTAPGLGTCLIQALTASDFAIIPLICDPQALQGLHQVNETINQVKKYCNSSLKVAGVVLTQYDARATLTKQFEELIKEQCEEMQLHFANTHIRRAVAIQEAQAFRKNLFEYAPKCKPAIDYMQLIEELSL